jgi:hypothetical protein
LVPSSRGIDAGVVGPGGLSLPSGVPKVLGHIGKGSEEEDIVLEGGGLNSGKLDKVSIVSWKERELIGESGDSSSDMLLLCRFVLRVLIALGFS